MIDENKKQEYNQQKERVRKRINAKIDVENYEFIPAREQVDYYDNNIYRRVAVYARVSTGSVQQTSSYELQKRYYEDFVVHHPNWTLVHIYADEGISGTSLARRDEFNQMIADCKNGTIDIIITKSVSRFARNVVDCISTVRMLTELPHPVGVFFESECIFSLKDDSQMALSFQATMAQEESHIRSRSMETSLRMRLDGGLPLTPKLLGYSHDSEGQLIINPQEAPTVKLIFYMYLYGYSTGEIAQRLTELGKKTYLGNVVWTTNSIIQVLRNERHCGDVLTRKTFTPNYLTHKSKKNNGDRPQSIYRNHHEAIVSRDDFIAVQQLLNNSKYGNKSILPELRVIDSGLLRGFVRVNPRWSGFKSSDYYNAATSISNEESICDMDGFESEKPDLHIQVVAGDFDMRGFEITRTEFFDSTTRPYITFHDKKVKFSMACVRKFGKSNHVELLVNPKDGRLAVRTTDKGNRQCVQCSRVSNGIYYPKEIAASAYFHILYQLFGWNLNFKYRISGQLYQKGNELVYIFNTKDGEVFIKPSIFDSETKQVEDDFLAKPLSTLGTKIHAIPQEWTRSFGQTFYEHRHDSGTNTLHADEDLTVSGRVFETGDPIQVTHADELQQYINLAFASKEGGVDNG